MIRLDILFRSSLEDDPLPVLSYWEIKVLDDNDPRSGFSGIDTVYFSGPKPHLLRYHLVDRDSGGPTFRFPFNMVERLEMKGT